MAICNTQERKIEFIIIFLLFTYYCLYCQLLTNTILYIYGLLYEYLFTTWTDRREKNNKQKLTKYEYQTKINNVKINIAIIQSTTK